jgi:hypothetical protein
VPQNRQPGCDDLGPKITVTVSWFEPQNKAGFGLSVAPQNRRREVDVGHALRSNNLFRLEVNHAMISHSGLKTGGCVMMSGAHDIITEVVSSRS